MDKCDSKGFSLELFCILLLPDEPPESDSRIHRATGVLLPILNTCRSELVICFNRVVLDESRKYVSFPPRGS